VRCSASTSRSTDGGLLHALVAGRRSGAYRAVGLTLTGAGSQRTLELALDASTDGERVFDVVQATFNVLEPSLRGALLGAHEAGLGVILKEVHANGRLSPANQRPEDQRLRTRLGEIGARCGLASDQLALAFAAALPAANVLLSGAATSAQLASHAAAVAVTLDATTLGELAELAETPQAYWQSRAGLAWS